jgi:AmmeMemoRadiSam system protein A
MTIRTTMSETGRDNDRLTPAEQMFLRDLAWSVVTAAVRRLSAPDPRAMAAAAGLDLAPRLSTPRGAFVTLHRDGRLRGCLGHIEGTLPLVETVAHNARAAALADPRFAPVLPVELAGLELEISALTPLQAVAGPEAIVIGRHGIVLAKGRHRAVFLPQVAIEQGWDRATTLSQLALKAGLTAGDWRTGAHYQVFEAEVF